MAYLGDNNLHDNLAGLSVEGAWADYGVRVGDPVASDAERHRRRSQRGGDEPFFDRGPGYRMLSGGRASAEVDFG